MAMGRDAITLRLVAAGALVVLVLWPEALVGPSFQMSFAAVVALVSLGEHPAFRTFVAARDEGMWRRLGRNLAGKTGRASCRARAVQYVRISVDAGSLKKKQQ